jgi:hypothetical protein
MTVIRFPVIAALCTSAFAYAQAPPSQAPAQEVAVPPVSTPAAQDTQSTPDAVPQKDDVPPPAVPTNVLGADGRPMRAPTTLPRPVEPSSPGLGRYSEGYLP